MLVLLPPSEGKTAPPAGPPLDLPGLAFPSLAAVRERIATRLQRLCSGPPAKARLALGLSARQDLERLHNAELFDAPTAPAWMVYTGVLYDALDAQSLPAVARRRLADHVVIASALFGMVRAGDHIPAYRLSADSVIPGIGPLADIWRGRLPSALTDAAEGGIVLDLRSSAYVALAPIPSEIAERTAVGRVLHDGKVVSHHNKATKGRMVRGLMSGRLPATIPGLASNLSRQGYDITIEEPAREGRPWGLDVHVRTL